MPVPAVALIISPFSTPKQQQEGSIKVREQALEEQTSDVRIHLNCDDSLAGAVISQRVKLPIQNLTRKSYSMDELLNTIQLATFPLELIGFTLAFIEIRSPELSARLSTQLTAIAHQVISTVASKEQPKLSARRVWLNTRVYPVFALASFFLAASSIIILLLSGALFDANWPGLLQFLNHWISAAIITTVSLATVIVMFLALSVAFFPGREIGTAGLLIAALGLAGEFFQYINVIT